MSDSPVKPLVRGLEGSLIRRKLFCGNLKLGSRGASAFGLVRGYPPVLITYGERGESAMAQVRALRGLKWGYPLPEGGGREGKEPGACPDDVARACGRARSARAPACTGFGWVCGGTGVRCSGGLFGLFRTGLGVGAGPIWAGWRGAKLRAHARGWHVCMRRLGTRPEPSPRHFAEVRIAAAHLPPGPSPNLCM